MKIPAAIRTMLAGPAQKDLRACWGDASPNRNCLMRRAARRMYSSNSRALPRGMKDWGIQTGTRRSVGECSLGLEGVEGHLHSLPSQDDHKEDGHQCGQDLNSQGGPSAQMNGHEIDLDVGVFLEGV